MTSETKDKVNRLHQMLLEVEDFIVNQLDEENTTDMFTAQKSCLDSVARGVSISVKAMELIKSC